MLRRDKYRLFRGNSAELSVTQIYRQASLSLLDLLTKISLNTVLTKGWIKKSCVKKANGKLKQTSLSQFASRVHILNPA